VTTRDHRKAIPLGVKLHVALARFGLRLADVQFDHHPPLQLREWDEAAGDTIPPANDPAHIQMLLIAEHKAKTFGRRGEKTATTAGSDIGNIAKARRCAKRNAEFNALLAAKEPGQPRKKTSRIPSRPFQKRKRTI
jgi:hypothetical protein